MCWKQQQKFMHGFWIVNMKEKASSGLLKGCLYGTCVGTLWVSIWIGASTEYLKKNNIMIWSTICRMWHSMIFPRAAESVVYLGWGSCLEHSVIALHSGAIIWTHLGNDQRNGISIHHHPGYIVSNPQSMPYCIALEFSTRLKKKKSLFHLT